MITKINGLINKIPIIRKIYSKLLSSILCSKKEFMVCFKNIKVLINIKDPLDKLIFYKNEYDEKQIDFLHWWINKNKPDIFIDIGANFGLYSLRTAKLFKTLKVIAFEPVLTTFNKLKLNIKINNLEKKIKTYNFGLSNTDGIKKMIALKRRNYVQSGGFSFDIPKRKIAKDEIIQFHKSKVGDKFLKFKNKIIVIKIDVEGYEDKVLLGIKNLMQSNKIFLQIEIFDKNFSKINKFLLKKGFKFINKFEKTSDYFFINH
jgi:FkbM family methyltransferase